MINSPVDVLAGLVARMGGLPDVITDVGLERYLAARITNGQPRTERTAPIERQESIAIFHVEGVLTPKVESWDEVSSLALAAALDAARLDESVTAGLLMIDSPGGYAQGMVELAGAAAAFAAAKPLDAQIGLCCCSGAYWLASQCRAIYSGPRSDVGSIGVRSHIYDWSGMLKNLGVEAVSFATGPLKALGVFGTPITDAQREFMQQRVDSIMADFSEAVQRGRKLTDEQMAIVTTGGYWPGATAEQLKLVTGIQGPTQTKAGLMAGGAKPKTRSKAMAEHDDAPKAATHKELKAALPEASAEFILGQLEVEATVDTALRAYNSHLAAELKTAKEATAAAEEKAAKAAGTPAKPPGKPPTKTVDGLGNGSEGTGSQATTPTIDYWEEAAAYQKEHKVRWSEACRQIKRKYGEAARAAFMEGSKGEPT